MLSHRWTDKRGALPWLYFGDVLPTGKVNRPNDLIHEAYTLDGLSQYHDYGGRLGSELEPRELIRSLDRYLTHEKIYEFPIEEDSKHSEAWAGLWGVGYALYVASNVENRAAIFESSLSKTLYNFLVNHYRNGGLWLYRPGDPTDCRDLPRQITNVLLGLAWYEFPGAR